MKDPLGKNSDAVLISDVIYGHSDAKILLQNAWNSLAVDGVLIVRGYLRTVLSFLHHRPPQSLLFGENVIHHGDNQPSDGS